MLIFLFIQNNAIDHIGGKSEKRISSEIGLHFFIRRGTDKFCTDTFQSFIYQPYFFICQIGVPLQTKSDSSFISITEILIISYDNMIKKFNIQSISCFKNHSCQSIIRSTWINISARVVMY